MELVAAVVVVAQRFRFAVPLERLLPPPASSGVLHAVQYDVASICGIVSSVIWYNVLCGGEGAGLNGSQPLNLTKTFRIKLVHGNGQCHVAFRHAYVFEGNIF